MKKAVQFQTEDAALRIAEYFPYAHIEGDRLKFAEFDDRAFELAANLEGIDKSTYYYVIGKILLKIKGSDELRNFELTVKANVNGKVISQDSDGKVLSSGYKDYSLIIDCELFALVEVVFELSKYWHRKDISELEINHASFIIKWDNSFFEYFLFLKNRFGSERFLLLPKDVKSFSFEEF